MDSTLQKQLDNQQHKIDQIYDSVKRTERYMRLTFWVTIGIVVLPIIASVLIIPTLISSLTDVTAVYHL